MFDALLLELSHGKNHVYSTSSGPEATPCLWEVLLRDSDESVEDNSGKYLSCDREERDAYVVPAV